MKHTKPHHKYTTDSCCKKMDVGKKHNGFWQGFAYGIIPHIGCIAFIIVSVLGVTVLTQLFKSLLMNRYFFYTLMGLSLLFATLSSVLYLKKLEMLSFEGIVKKKAYLFTMYATTAGVNLILFLVLFPMLANINSGAVYNQQLGILKIKVAIPCPGHAPLITNELKTIEGVQDVKFSFPNIFYVQYSSKTKKQEILSLSVFKKYKATEILIN